MQEEERHENSGYILAIAKRRNIQTLSLVNPDNDVIKEASRKPQLMIERRTNMQRLTDTERSGPPAAKTGEE